MAQGLATSNSFGNKLCVRPVWVIDRRRWNIKKITNRKCFEVTYTTKEIKKTKRAADLK